MNAFEADPGNRRDPRFEQDHQPQSELIAERNTLVTDVAKRLAELGEIEPDTDPLSLIDHISIVRAKVEGEQTKRAFQTWGEPFTPVLVVYREQPRVVAEPETAEVFVQPQPWWREQIIPDSEQTYPMALVLNRHAADGSYITLPSLRPSTHRPSFVFDEQNEREFSHQVPPFGIAMMGPGKNSQFQLIEDALLIAIPARGSGRYVQFAPVDMLVGADTRIADATGRLIQENMGTEEDVDSGESQNNMDVWRAQAASGQLSIYDISDLFDAGELDPSQTHELRGILFSGWSNPVDKMDTDLLVIPNYEQQVRDGELSWTGVVDLYLNGKIGMEEMMRLNRIDAPYERPRSSATVFEMQSQAVSEPSVPSAASESNPALLKHLQRMAKEGGLTVSEIENLQRKGRITDAIRDELLAAVDHRTRKREAYIIPDGTIPGRIVHSPYDDERDDLDREFGSRRRLDPRRGEGNMVDIWQKDGDVYSSGAKPKQIQIEKKPKGPKMTERERLDLLTKVQQKKKKGKEDKKIESRRDKDYKNRFKGV